MKANPEVWAIVTVERAMRKARATLAQAQHENPPQQPKEPEPAARAAKRPAALIVKTKRLATLTLFSFLAATAFADATIDPAIADPSLDGVALECYMFDHMVDDEAAL